MDRRIPVVTCVLALLCVLGFLYAKLEAVGVEAVVDTELDAAAQTLRDRPYLLLPPLLETRIPRDDALRMRRDHERARVGRSAPRVPQRVVVRQQAELDRRVAAAEHRIESLPTRRFGLRATERNPLTFPTHLFFHGGVLHLVANLLLLVLFGCLLESAWGGAVHACVVSAGVLGGTAAFFAQHPFYGEPLIGISGPVAGLVGAFAVHFAGQRGRVIYAPSLLLAVLVLGLPVWLGFEWSIARGPAADPARFGAWNPSMAMLAGGFAGGALAALGVRLLGLEGRIGRAEVEAAPRAPTSDPELLGTTREALVAFRAPGDSAAGAPSLGHTYTPAGVVLPGPDQPPVIGPDGIEFEEEPRELQCLEVVPVRLGDEALHVAVGGLKKRVRYDRVKAVAVAAVPGLRAKLVIVIDLVLNWGSLGDEPLRVVRLRTDRFDPRSLASGPAEPLEAVRALVKQLLRRSDAMPLPDLNSARGAPFASFKSLGDYNRDVLAVDAPDDA